ncbi:hypothetical protein GCM10009347_30660 [Shewanella algicola]|uniref:Type VI secretion protein n=1 Tax=Shewanella algicola TaxID=640633 RepID=A0A9X2CEX6_9GAMM|nr:hypothetical protein [Shewanella algicola]MCL1106782.1 type VI secretion protein [Shewanella algicola]GGP62451.1 hypothetical protein GCM10009347_30660 [Shewanella algicola]
MRLCLIATGILLISVNAQANTQLGEQLSFCAQKTNNTERLSCYDQLAANAKPSANISLPAVAKAPTVAVTANKPAAPVVASVPPQPVKPVAITVPATASPELSVNDFGLQKKVIEDEIDRLYFTVANVSKAPGGALIVTLENGQVWKQTNAERYKVKKGHDIYIETGALNSFLMGSDERNATTRVKRLK